MPDTSASTLKIYSATKWSAVTNLLSKIVPPVSNMLLARLLTPEAFGVVATINLVITFADIFTDAGFQKYIVQHEFSDDEALFRGTNVAFWSNLILSLFAWLVIFLFSKQLAELVGSSGYGFHLVIAALNIPLLSFSSIQQAVFRRDLNFKGLFFPKLVRSVVPLVVTVPLAFVFRNCWALIIGTLCANLSDAILLTVKSRWHPKLYFSKSEFKIMFSFSFWTLLESLSIWGASNIDIFIISKKLSAHYLGVYKTSILTVNQITGLIAVTILPVLFSSLSRVQNNDDEFFSLYLKFQKFAAIILIPLSVGMFVFKSLITKVMLGSQWVEAIDFIGLLSLMQFVYVLISNFASEVYRAKGKPKISFFVQLVYVLVMAILVYIGASSGFEKLCFIRICLFLIFAVMNLFVLAVVFHFNVLKILNNFTVPLLCSAFMGIVGYFLLKLNDNIFLQIAYILVCIILYFATLFCFPKERQLLFTRIKNFKK